MLELDQEANSNHVTVDEYAPAPALRCDPGTGGRTKVARPCKSATISDDQRGTPSPPLTRNRRESAAKVPEVGPCRSLPAAEGESVRSRLTRGYRWPLASDGSGARTVRSQASRTSLGGRQSRPLRLSTALTVEGHHCLPPCAVGTPSVLSSRAISPRLRPALCADSIRSTTSSGSRRGRPRNVGAGRGLAARRRSARRSSSSSTGIRRAPQSISTVSTHGRTRLRRISRVRRSRRRTRTRFVVRFASSRRSTRSVTSLTSSSSVCSTLPSGRGSVLASCAP
jgi:hypothetical protein